jgi:citrate lyase beta subunit
MSLIDEAKSHLDALGVANRVFMQRYPGDRPNRQPVHTVYGGAQLYRADTTRRLGELALRHLGSYGPDALEFGRAVGFVTSQALSSSNEAMLSSDYEQNRDELRARNPSAWLAFTVYERVRTKLEREPVEDFRIDFEDGFGARPDDEEDATAKAAAHEVAFGMREGTLPPFLGIRIKSFSEEWKRRGARTLELFVDTLLEQSGGKLPENFVVTLPKITVPEQASTLVRLFELLEKRHGLPSGTLQMEMMIEVTQAVLDPQGRSPLPDFLTACEGRCAGAHFGTYDFTASCNITAAYQTMAHPWCDFAKAMMMMAYAGTGIFL